MSIDTSDDEVLRMAADWLDAGHRVELVTVVRTFGSSPRPVGSLAAVRDDGSLVGSVSGGCIEKQLAESRLGLATARACTHRIDDHQARQFGLACGGQLELVFETLESAEPLRRILDGLVRRDRMVRRLTIDKAHVCIDTAAPQERTRYDGRTLHKVFGPTWRVLLIGAGQLSRYTAEFALALDFEVYVCDPREHFRQAWQVDRAILVDEMPDDAVREYAGDSHSAVLALTHDPTLDDLALEEALPGAPFHVGALGSERSHVKRCARLRFLGLADTDIARLSAPVGLSIGSRSAAEIAVSIVAELVQVRAAQRRRHGSAPI